jgi:hypothetical protein
MCWEKDSVPSSHTPKYLYEGTSSNSKPSEVVITPVGSVLLAKPHNLCFGGVEGVLELSLQTGVFLTGWYTWARCCMMSEGWKWMSCRHLHPIKGILKNRILPLSLYRWMLAGLGSGLSWAAVYLEWPWPGKQQKQQIISMWFNIVAWLYCLPPTCYGNVIMLDCYCYRLSRIWWLEKMCDVLKGSQWELWLMIHRLNSNSSKVLKSLKDLSWVCLSQLWIRPLDTVYSRPRPVWI